MRYLKFIGNFRDLKKHGFKYDGYGMKRYTLYTKPKRGVEIMTIDVAKRIVRPRNIDSVCEAGIILDLIRDKKLHRHSKGKFGRIETYMLAMNLKPHAWMAYKYNSKLHCPTTVGMLAGQNGVFNKVAAQKVEDEFVTIHLRQDLVDVLKRFDQQRLITHQYFVGNIFDKQPDYIRIET